MTVFEDLLALQDCDSALDQLRYRRANHPARLRLRELEGALGALAAGRVPVDAEAAAVAARQGALEAEAATIEARRAELRKRLSTGTVPRELQAWQDELDSVGGRLSAVEDELLDLMERAEALAGQLGELDERRGALDDEAASQRVALAEAEVALDGEEAEAKAARAAAVTAVPDDLLRRYEQLRPKLAGVAVARLEHGRCTGCHLQLPTTEVDRIRHESADASMECEQCGRILVLVR